MGGQKAERSRVSGRALGRPGTFRAQGKASLCPLPQWPRLGLALAALLLTLGPHPTWRSGAA